MFTYSFMQRALIVGILVSLCAALLGVSLVLKRFSMIGDGLSHVGFGALSVALAAGISPLYISIPVVIIAAFFLLRLSESGKLKGDAAVAVVSSVALAAGVIVTSVSSGMNADVYSYMFGSILAMSASDVVFSVILSAVVLTLYVLFYNKIFSVTFDERFAHSNGTNVRGYTMLLSILTALTVVIGMRLMGTLLISSLIIFPALSSMRVFSTFRSVIICAAVTSVACFFIGMVLSFMLSIPAGASVVAVNFVVFCGFAAVGKLRS